MPVQTPQIAEPPTTPPPPLVIEGAGQTQAHTTKLRQSIGSLPRMPITHTRSTTNEEPSERASKRFPGIPRLTESTVENQGQTTEGGGDGGPGVRMYDVGPARRALLVAEDVTPLACSAWHIPTAIARQGSQEDPMPKCRSHRAATATAVHDDLGRTI